MLGAPCTHSLFAKHLIQGVGNKIGSSFLPHSYYSHLPFPLFNDSMGEFLALKSLFAAQYVHLVKPQLQI